MWTLPGFSLVLAGGDQRGVRGLCPAPLFLVASRLTRARAWANLVTWFSQVPWRRLQFEPGDVPDHQPFSSCCWIQSGFSRAPVWPHLKKTRARQACAIGKAPAPLCSSNLPDLAELENRLKKPKLQRWQSWGVGGGRAESTVTAVTHAGASLSTQRTALSHSYAIKEACGGGEGMKSHWSKEKWVQWGLSGKGWRHHSICWRFSPRDAPQRASRLQAPGDGLARALQSFISRGPRGWGSLGWPAQEQKSPCGIPAGWMTCPRSSKEGCGSWLLLVLLCSSASRSRAMFGRRGQGEETL